MAKACSICSSPDGAAIDDLLNAGVTQRDVAEQFSLSKFAVSRHVRHARATEGNASPTEISKWLSRADDQYLTAVANADQRAAVQSLVAGLRAVEAELKNREREFELNRDKADGVPSITIEQFDEVIRQAEVFHASVGSPSMLILNVCSHVSMVLHHYQTPEALDLMSKFLSCSKPDAKLSQDFAAFVAKRRATQTPDPDPAKQLAWSQSVPAVHGGN